MKKEMWLIWKDSVSRRRYKIGILTYDGSKYTFKYVNPELNDATKVGFKYFPGFGDVHKTYESNLLFANILMGIALVLCQYLGVYVLINIAVCIIVYFAALKLMKINILRLLR